MIFILLQPLYFISPFFALVSKNGHQVLTNTHTLQTPTLDPLGLSLDPASALLNHSCAPNTAITFSSHGSLSLRALVSIGASSPLTVCYIDATLPSAQRIAELKSRYFFTCKCSLCLAHCTASLENPDLPPSAQQLALESETAELLSRAAAVSPPSAEPISLLYRAESLFKPYATTYRPYKHPLPIIHTHIFQTSLSLRNYLLALQHALILYFNADPVLYPQSWHPVRIVRKWVILKLVGQIAEEMAEKGGDEDGKGGGNVDWGIVVWGLWKEVMDGVGKSHGAESSLGEEVKRFGEEGNLVGRVVSREDLELAWKGLRRLARSGS